jgi:hypothetical protein
MPLFDTCCQVSGSQQENQPEFFRLLSEHIDWDAIIPARFYLAFYQRFGRKRKYQLESFIKALVLQNVLGYIVKPAIPPPLKPIYFCPVSFS